MFNPNRIGELRQLLQKLAEEETLMDADGNAYDYSGGNYDDAHSIGIEDGRIELARELLAEFFDKRPEEQKKGG